MSQWLLNRVNDIERVKLFFNLWARLSRIPFLSVGILPLILGFVLAWKRGYKGSVEIYLISTITVLLIMEMTYYLGEFNDQRGDQLNKNFNRFSGGSRVLVEGEISPLIALILGYGCLLVAIFLIVYIYIQFQRDPRIFILGGLGIFSGYFYSNKPFKWSHHGIGEILIAICYGWLPIASGFFITSGFFSKDIISLSIPVALSIFNVILINEFPDEEADRAIGKRNMVVRLGKQRAGDLYIGISIFTALSFIKVISKFNKTPIWIWIISALPLLLILINLMLVWREKYYDKEKLENLCFNTLIVNLLITMTFTIQQMFIIF